MAVGGGGDPPCARPFQPLQATAHFLKYLLSSCFHSFVENRLSHAAERRSRLISREGSRGSVTWTLFPWGTLAPRSPAPQQLIGAVD